MSIAALLALLLTSGVCAESTFVGPDGVTLHVVICPHLVPTEPAKPDPKAHT